MEIMDEENSMQVKGYKEEIKNFTVQIDSLNQTIEDLSQKISSIMSKMDEGNYDNRLEEKKPSINLQKSLNNQKRDGFRKNAQKKEYTTISSIPQTNLPSSYNDLHKIVSQSKSIEELPTALSPAPKDCFSKEYTRRTAIFRQSKYSIKQHES